MNPNGNRYIFGHLSITMRRKVAASKSSVLSSPPSRSESNSTGSTSGSWSQSQSGSRKSGSHNQVPTIRFPQSGSHNQDHNQVPTISFPQSGSRNQVPVNPPGNLFPLFPVGISHFSLAQIQQRIRKCADQN